MGNLIVPHSMAESIQIGVEEETSSRVKVHGRADQSDQKVASLQRIVLVTNFILELPSVVFDQLSSTHKPQYALLNMLMSFAVMIISITDLVYRAKKGRTTWMKRGLIPWFYYPYPNFKPFGTFPDIIGSVCAIFQWIFASIAYVFLSQNANNPVQVSIWPIIFAFGLLCSRLSENPLQRSTSHLRKLNKAKEFTLAELAAATDDFSVDNRIGEGRFVIVYKGRLLDGHEVAIKRWDIGQGEEFKEKDSAFESELAYMLRLHHKNLVGLLGYCEEGTERLLVFDYMKNRSLKNQLFLKDSSVIDSWVMRIKIALDAARGIDYLHNYAVPPLIHRSIKSSSVLLNENWIARFADFELAMMGLECEQDNQSKRAAEIVDGYVDPEYYALNILTARSDVYSFGVLLLELLTGKRAIFKDSDNEGKVTSLVYFAVPKILQNQFVDILDSRIGPPESDNEAEAVELVAYTALYCVNSKGINRPTMTSIVSNLEQALSLLNDKTEDYRLGDAAEQPYGRTRRHETTKSTD